MTNSTPDPEEAQRIDDQKQDTEGQEEEDISDIEEEQELENPIEGFVLLKFNSNRFYCYY